MRLDAQEAIRIKNLVSKKYRLGVFGTNRSRAHRVMAPSIPDSEFNPVSAAVPTQTLAELREHFFNRNTGRKPVF